MKKMIGRIMELEPRIGIRKVKYCLKSDILAISYLIFVSEIVVFSIQQLHSVLVDSN